MTTPAASTASTAYRSLDLRGIPVQSAVPDDAVSLRPRRPVPVLRLRARLVYSPFGQSLTGIRENMRRMYKAGALKRSKHTSLFEVAAAVGYGSESSCSRVFKREMGVAPRE